MGSDLSQKLESSDTRGSRKTVSFTNGSKIIQNSKYGNGPHYGSTSIFEALYDITWGLDIQKEHFVALRRSLKKYFSFSEDGWYRVATLLEEHPTLPDNHLHLVLATDLVFSQMKQVKRQKKRAYSMQSHIITEEKRDDWEIVYRFKAQLISDLVYGRMQKMLQTVDKPELLDEEESDKEISPIGTFPKNPPSHPGTYITPQTTPRKNSPQDYSIAWNGSSTVDKLSDRISGEEFRTAFSESAEDTLEKLQKYKVEKVEVSENELEDSENE